MADLRIERGGFTPSTDFGEVQENLGLLEESTSLPEWQGWDRIENCGFFEQPTISPLDVSSDLSSILDQIRSDPDYNAMPDLDDKAFLLDVLNKVSAKLEDIVQNTGSERLQNFQETLNELLELQQHVYVQQLGSIKG
jgi:hypothetical protein